MIHHPDVDHRLVVSVGSECFELSTSCFVVAPLLGGKSFLDSCERCALNRDNSCENDQFCLHVLCRVVRCVYRSANGVTEVVQPTRLCTHPPGLTTHDCDKIS